MFSHMPIFSRVEMEQVPISYLLVMFVGYLILTCLFLAVSSMVARDHLLRACMIFCGVFMLVQCLRIIRAIFFKIKRH